VTAALGATAGPGSPGEQQHMVLMVCQHPSVLPSSPRDPGAGSGSPGEQQHVVLMVCQHLPPSSPGDPRAGTVPRWGHLERLTTLHPFSSRAALAGAWPRNGPSQRPGPHSAGLGTVFCVTGTWSRCSAPARAWPSTFRVRWDRPGAGCEEGDGWWPPRCP